MKRLFLAVSMIGCLTLAHAQDGIVASASPHDVDRTVDKLIAALESKGMTVFDRIDHSANASRAGKALRPTTLVIFGNPDVGTPFMQCGQSVAIDLPQKMLVWLDEDGQVYAGYNDPQYLADRHAMSGCEELVGNIGNALANFAQAATSP